MAVPAGDDGVHASTVAAKKAAAAATVPGKAGANAKDVRRGAPLLDVQTALDHYRRAERRIFFFDYDGTLSPICDSPEAAIPSADVIAALRRIAASEQNILFIVSGRDCAFLDRYFGAAIPGIGLSGEHGCFVKLPTRHGGDGGWASIVAEDGLSLGWKAPVLRIFEQFTAATPGSSVEQKQASLTWHYRAAEPELGERQAVACHETVVRDVVPHFDAEVMIGKMNVEVRPRAANKGQIVKRLLASLGAGADFVFCAGDDRTDEDMFAALNAESGATERHTMCVWVGDADRPTNAGWRMNSPSTVIDMVAQWASHERSSPPDN